MDGSKKSYETYKKVKTLGVGSFGTAYLVECQSDKMYAVIKQIDIQQMDENERKETLREAKILEVLQHPNIVRFREVYKTKKGKLCIVMDYADGGDLQGRIKEKYKSREQNGGTLQHWDENHVLNWFTQICLALKHVHDRKILHRDLKSQNIFLTKNNMIKLGDFGIARVLSETRSKAKTVVGTPYYLSPEIIKSLPYSFKSDIWSLGVLLYEMCSLQPPFNANSLHDLARKIIVGKYSDIPAHFSSNVRNLLKSMLNTDPDKRPNVNQILRYPVIEERVHRLLNEDEFKDEFSHTILHNQNVFDEFKNMQNQKKLDEEKKEQEKIALEKQMAAIKLNDYKPKYGQDAQLFNELYMNYVDSLSKDQESAVSSGYGDRPYSQQSQETIDEDRNEHDDDKHSTASSQAHTIAPGKKYAKQEDQQMIDISGCEFSEFQKYMVNQFGQETFMEGFKIIRDNRNLIYEDDGEAKISQLLKNLQFKSVEDLRGFLNFCTTFLIVQNMQI